MGWLLSLPLPQAELFVLAGNSSGDLKDELKRLEAALQALGTRRAEVREH